VGLFLAAILSSSHVRKETTAYERTEETLDRAVMGIREFYKTNKRLPCPASLTVRQGANPFSGQILYGMEPTGNFACGGATAPTLATHGIHEYRQSGTARWIRIGMLPTRSLGLPDSAGIDGWGNRIWYTVIEELAESEAAFNGFTPPASPHESISVVRQLSPLTSVVPLSSGDAMAYVLVSMGKDGIGAYTKSGGLKAACDTVLPRSFESYNCDADDRYAFGTINESATDNYFYDSLRWERYLDIKR
jgi:hypothetical protein